MINQNKCGDKETEGMGAFATCVHMIDKEFCTIPQHFRCIEKVPTLSYSGMNNFMKCPMLYKLSNIDGWSLKWEGLSDALKIGSWVDSKLTGSEDKSTEEDKKSIWMMKAQAMLKGINRLSPIDMNVYDSQVKCIIDLGEFKVRGFLDFQKKDVSSLIELKCSSKPAFYLNKYWIHDQVGTYFLHDDRLKFVEMYVMRTPGLRVAEELKDYRQRCYDDMVKRPDFYINRVKFYRDEFDLKRIKKRYRWLGGQIQDCIESDYWYQDRTQCLGKWKCDMMSICEGEGVSKRLYEKRERK
jgi:hypothetical protein